MLYVYRIPLLDYSITVKTSYVDDILINLTDKKPEVICDKRKIVDINGYGYFVSYFNEEQLQCKKNILRNSIEITECYCCIEAKNKKSAIKLFKENWFGANYDGCEKRQPLIININEKIIKSKQCEYLYCDNNGGAYCDLEGNKSTTLDCIISDPGIDIDDYCPYYEKEDY